MSVEHLSVVLHHSTAKGTRKLVLLGIANHQGDGGSWPTIRTLARYANVDRRTVQRAIEWLADHGEVAVELQAGGPRDMDDDDRPNQYHVLVSCPSWCDRTTNHRDTRGRPPHLGLSLFRGGGTHAAPPATPTPPGGAAPTPPRTFQVTTPPTPPPPMDPDEVAARQRAAIAKARMGGR